MAEEEQVPSTATEETTKPAEGEQVSPEPSFYGGKYKTQKDFEDAYKNAERKIQEQGGKLSEYETFEQQVTPLLNVIAEDPTLLDTVKTKLTGGKSEKKSEKEETKEDPRINELLQSKQNDIYANFERSHGLDRLDPDKLKETRAEIGKIMARLSKGHQVGLVDLPVSLEDAYTLLNVNKLRESGKNEGYIEALMAKNASIGAVPESGTTTSGLPELSADEKRVADKMHMSLKDYAEYKAKIRESK